VAIWLPLLHQTIATTLSSLLPLRTSMGVG